MSIGVFLGKWLTLAFFLESLMVAYVSSDWIAAYVGADNPFAIPLAAIVGAPSYLNGYAAIPLVSGLIEIGMTPGAAMAFVTAGAVSSSGRNRGLGAGQKAGFRALSNARTDRFDNHRVDIPAFRWRSSKLQYCGSSPRRMGV